MDQPLRTTLADAAAFLQEKCILYALIGGLAASLRGQPRVTADVDLVIATDLERALSLLPQLEVSKFRPLFEDVAEVVTAAYLLPLRHRETNIKVDIAIGLSGFERQAVARAEVLELAGEQICVATAEDLLIMKLIAGRPQDEQDMRGIVLARGDQLDWDYCMNLATELEKAIDVNLTGRLQKLRDEAEMPN